MRGAEHFEQLRTMISRIQVFISGILEILLKIAFLNSMNLGERTLHANPTPGFTFGSFFLSFLETIS